MSDGGNAVWWKKAIVRPAVIVSARTAGKGASPWSFLTPEAAAALTVPGGDRAAPATIPLGQVASVTPSLGPAVINHLDRDNVITKFEYDINLSNGWESTPGTGDLRTVNGVEANVNPGVVRSVKRR